MAETKKQQPPKPEVEDDESFAEELAQKAELSAMGLPKPKTVLSNAYRGKK